jgi:DNA repair protein RadD
MYQLRPYQKQAVDRALQYFRRSRHPAVIVLPTGAGKSLVIAELSRLARGRVLVLAHVKELVEQNYLKFKTYNLEAGIYSAGLDRKEINQKVIFGSIQSVARASDHFFKDFNLVIIDECHRIGLEAESQYQQVLRQLKDNNQRLCVLGLTATPYRLGMGWIYQESDKGEIKTKEERFFKRCVFELPLEHMIQHDYLTRPIKLDIPVTSYDFSELKLKDGRYLSSEIESVLQKQRRLTPLIIKNIIDITEKYQRQGVMIFSSTVAHAQEIMQYLPQGQARLVIGDTPGPERDQIIHAFKQKQFKYLVNVSVLTTGFDAPHVDIIAILRPTESSSLYQQIIGRGLRLSEGKKECYVLDYTGIGHDIFGPQISDRKPNSESEPVLVTCPSCGFDNQFWGKTDEFGELIEHYGRNCRGAREDLDSGEYIACGYRFRFKRCPNCQGENDITARNCEHCQETLIDADTKLKQARLSKNAHIMRPDHIEMEQKHDRKGQAYLQIRYYDVDAEYLSEFFYLNNQTSIKKFHINFLRFHSKLPERPFPVNSIQTVLEHKHLLRMPQFIIGRKQGKFWRITEKIFGEEVNHAQRFM